MDLSEFLNEQRALRYAHWNSVLSSCSLDGGDCPAVIVRTRVGVLSAGDQTRHKRLLHARRRKITPLKHIFELLHAPVLKLSFQHCGHYAEQKALAPAAPFTSQAPVECEGAKLFPPEMPTKSGEILPGSAFFCSSLVSLHPVMLCTARSVSRCAARKVQRGSAAIRSILIFKGSSRCFATRRRTAGFIQPTKYTLAYALRRTELFLVYREIVEWKQDDGNFSEEDLELDGQKLFSKGAQKRSIGVRIALRLRFGRFS